MSKGSLYANAIYNSNQSAWKSIEPILNLPRARPAISVKKKEERQVKPEPKEKLKRKSQRGKGIKKELIKNPRFSLTSFLIPLCITGQRKDYQLLYCICALKNALKLMSTTLRKEGFAQLYCRIPILKLTLFVKKNFKCISPLNRYMVGMKSKVDWIQIKYNKTSFSDIIIDFLIKSGTVCMVAAHRIEAIKKVYNTDAPFVVLLSATDIQLPCQANLCVGSSWMIFRRSTESRKSLFDREVFNCGRRALHSGIMITGCNTIMATAFKKLGGIHYFMFDITTGDFRLYQDACFMRRYGNLLSVNEALLYKFNPNVQHWLNEKKALKDDKEYCSRYTGGWVTDGYKVLRSGGLLLSPEDSGNNEGRIKYLFKAVPLAYLAEKAGGIASNGQASILKIQPMNSGFISLILGSVEEVDNYIKLVIRPHVTNESPPENETDYDDTSTDLDEE